MEILTNEGFYRLLVAQCAIDFMYQLETFNWIPFQVKLQLIMLFDAWKAAVMRLEWLLRRKSDTNPADIDRASAEKEERWQLFDLMLRKAYQDAEKLQQLNASHGILRAPAPDLHFWLQVCEREIYEARKAAGEPVVFYEGRCCLYGSLGDLIYPIVPGPYPGLQYYISTTDSNSPEEDFYWDLACVKAAEQSMQQTPVPMDWFGRFESPASVRQRLVADYGIVGPASYAEYVRQWEYRYKFPFCPTRVLA